MSVATPTPFAPLLKPRPADADAGAFEALAREGRAGEAAGIELFEVVAEGIFLGRRYAVGDLVVCRGAAAHGEPTVLVALGHGRPRLGRRWNGRWLGDAGEPCADARWRSAGRLVGRLVRGPSGDLVELFEAGATRTDPNAGRPAAAAPRAARPETGAARTEPTRRAPAAQLPLFAA